MIATEIPGGTTTPSTTGTHRVTATAINHIKGATPKNTAEPNRYAGPPLPEDPAAFEHALDAYRLQVYDVEDALNGMLGRDPEMHHPPRLSWEPLIELLAEHGTSVSDQDLIAMPFRFEFSADALAALEQE